MENKALLSEYEVLDDMMLDGLQIVQDTRLYRFTSDSVLLSRFAKAKNNDKVADFCAGSGIVAFHFHALNRHEKKNLRYTLFEMQEDLLNLAKKTAIYNGFDEFSFVQGKLQDIEKEHCEQYSLVLCNPPYENGGFDGEEYHKAVCRKEITITLKEIVQAAAYVLKFGGRLCLLHRADRLAEVCYTLKTYRLETKKIQFVAGRYGAKPYLVMVEAVKGGKPNCDILPTVYNVRGGDTKQPNTEKQKEKEEQIIEQQGERHD